jgi:hypothetical protein
VIDCIVAGVLIQRKPTREIPGPKCNKGNRWYTAMRFRNCARCARAGSQV